MLIEQLPSMPELIDDVFAWRPTTYQDYFTRSILPGRGSALEAYAALSQTFRRDFEAIVEELDRMAVGAIAAIRRHHKTKATPSSTYSPVSAPARAKRCAKSSIARRSS